MAHGPGKYDKLCSEIRRKSAAEGGVLIVLDANLGSGFSVQADVDTVAKLPSMLEDIARQIRASGN